MRDDTSGLKKNNVERNWIRTPGTILEAVQGWKEGMRRWRSKWRKKSGYEDDGKKDKGMRGRGLEKYDKKAIRDLKADLGWSWDGLE